MKNGMAVVLVDIPVEVWKYLGEKEVEFLTKLFKIMLDREKMLEKLRKTVLMLIFKNKGDAQSCCNHSGIKADDPQNEDLGKSNGIVAKGRNYDF